MDEKDALEDKHDIASRIMAAMLKMPPKPHKAEPPPLTSKGEAQRRRRQRERQDQARG